MTIFLEKTYADCTGSVNWCERQVTVNCRRIFKLSLEAFILFTCGIVKFSKAIFFYA